MSIEKITEKRYLYRGTVFKSIVNNLASRASDRSNFNPKMCLEYPPPERTLHNYLYFIITRVRKQLLDRFARLCEISVMDRYMRRVFHYALFNTTVWRYTQNAIYVSQKKK